MTCLFLLQAALLCSTGIAQAQINATITGRIEDASGSAVAGATITVKSLETGATRVTATDESGRFRVSALPLGHQEIKAEKQNFKTVVRTGVRLDVGQEAVVNLRLEVGEFVQQVVVSYETPMVNTTTSAVSGLVGERQVKELPLNGRSFDNLITLNPGAINYTLKSPQTSTSNGNTFSVSGRRPLDNLVLLNGVEYTGSSQLAITPGGVSGDLLGIDAVREFNVLTETYSSEYGKRAGAQVTVVTQSGTNQLHGSLFEFLRNNKLDARNYFDRGPAPPFRRNQFGGALGGPIRKDKFFLFGNYEGFRQRLAVSNVAVVPNAQARLGNVPNAQGVYAPAPNLNRAILPYMNFWPAANGAELLANGVQTGTALSFNNPRQAIREDFGTMRADYNLRAQDTLSASYTIDDGDSLIPLANPLFGSLTTLRMHVASAQHTHIFSPRMLNRLTVGFSRAGFGLDSQPLASFAPELSFVRGAGPGGIVIGGGATTTGVAAITAAGPNNAAGVWNRRNLFTYADSLEISRGRHQISVGVWFQRMRDNENTASRTLGQASFASLTTFLQGTVTTFQAVPNPTALGWRSTFGAWYFQDSIRLRRNLTLQAGLRHEFTTGWNEASGRGANYITDGSGVLQTAPRVANSVYTQNNSKKLFGPRIALAWDPFNDQKTSVRAGFGTYFTLIDALSFMLNSLPPYNGAISFAARSIFDVTPLIPGAAVPPSCGLGAPTPCTTFAPQGIQPDAKTPTVQEWNLTVERQLTSNMALRVAYVGSFGTHGLVSIDPNTIRAQNCADAAGCQAGGIGAAASQSRVAQGTRYIPVGTRPNPFLSSGFFWYTQGNSSYNALQLDMTRRLTQGLQFRVNYTWSKNLDHNSGLTGAQANNQAQMILDRDDLRRDWGPSALNVKHQSSISAHYDLPFGRGAGWQKKLIGGWQLNGIATLLSGFPFTPQVGTSRSGNGDTRNPDRPNYNPSFSGPVVLGQQARWFDPNAFTLPAFGTFGNVGRSVYSGPGLANVDLSLLKDTAVSENLRLQFRTEFFNAFNRTNLGNPNAIVFSSGTVSGSAGLITTTATASRQIQFGMKLIF